MENFINNVLKYFLLISALAVLIGAFFKLQHYPYGSTILWAGLWINFILSGIEINRLKKKLTKEKIEVK